MKNVKKIVAIALVIVTVLCVRGVAKTYRSQANTEVAFTIDPPLPR